jgi:RNA polymerase sigma-70 factor (ECF subfamily)
MKKAAELIEQLLLLRCQMGDKDALAELIERYERPLRYFINRLLDNSELTEDIFQDTWLTVIRRIHGLKEIDAFPAWLYRIARNKVYQQLRKKRNVSALDENIAVEDHAEEDDFSVEDAAKVHKCLKELPPEYREVLMLRFLEQMSYEQISQVLNCKLGTVRSRIYYAKIAIKRELEK